MASPEYPIGLWLTRCRTELSALVPFCAPALYGCITPKELQAWAEGIWTRDRASCPEVAAHRAMAQMLELTDSPVWQHGDGMTGSSQAQSNS